MSTTDSQTTQGTEGPSEPDLSPAIDAYFAAWNASPAERSDLVAAAFTPDAYYCDGASEATGHAAITMMMQGVMDQIPGAVVQRSSGIDHHHRQGRFNWEIRQADGELLIEGIDAVRAGSDGRTLDLVLGFFGTTVQEA